MLILLLMLIVFSFAVFLSFEAMKHGMCEKKWFFAGMCFGPVVWPMFNVKRQMLHRKQLSQHGCSLKA